MSKVVIYAWKWVWYFFNSLSITKNFFIPTAQEPANIHSRYTLKYYSFYPIFIHCLIYYCSLTTTKHTVCHSESYTQKCHWIRDEQCYTNCVVMRLVYAHVNAVWWLRVYYTPCVLTTGGGVTNEPLTLFES